jgi:hypothetical protein
VCTKTGYTAVENAWLRIQSENAPPPDPAAGLALWNLGLRLTA